MSETGIVFARRGVVRLRLVEGRCGCSDVRCFAVFVGWYPLQRTLFVLRAVPEGGRECYVRLQSCQNFSIIGKASYVTLSKHPYPIALNASDSRLGNAGLKASLFCFNQPNGVVTTTSSNAKLSPAATST